MANRSTMISDSDPGCHDRFGGCHMGRKDQGYERDSRLCKKNRETGESHYGDNGLKNRGK